MKGLTKTSEPISKAAKGKARNKYKRQTRETGLEFTLVLKFCFLRWSFVYCNWIGITGGGDGRRGQMREGRQGLQNKAQETRYCDGFEFDPC